MFLLFVIDLVYWFGMYWVFGNLMWIDLCDLIVYEVGDWFYVVGLFDLDVWGLYDVLWVVVFVVLGVLMLWFVLLGLYDGCLFDDECWLGWWLYVDVLLFVDFDLWCFGDLMFGDDMFGGIGMLIDLWWDVIELSYGVVIEVGL